MNDDFELRMVAHAADADWRSIASSWRRTAHAEPGRCRDRTLDQHRPLCPWFGLQRPHPRRRCGNPDPRLLSPQETCVYKKIPAISGAGIEISKGDFERRGSLKQNFILPSTLVSVCPLSPSCNILSSGQLKSCQWKEGQKGSQVLGSLKAMHSFRSNRESP